MTIDLLPPIGSGRQAVPRKLTSVRERSDRVFHGAAGAIGMVVLAVTAGIGLYLGYQAIPTLRHYGLSFFTQTQWLPELDRIGIAAVLVGTAEVALVAMVVSFPLALGLALFVSDYAPKWTKSWLVSAVDLMAAVPSIVYGLWGFFLLQPHAILVARWLSQYLGWIPIFQVGTDPNAAVWQQSRYTSSVFIAGLAVAMMTIPLATAVMRAVFDQAPIGEREAAMALGGTRFGVARTVVLPFGKGGIIGGTMLGLGRALGETIVVILIISPVFTINSHILQSGGNSISGLIANLYSESDAFGTSALMAAGLALFALTLAINFAASAVVARSRSGAESDG